MAAEVQTSAAGAVVTENLGESLLDQAISATRQTEPDQAKAMIRALAEEALKGTVTYSKSLTATINNMIAAIDGAMSTQLAAIMHHEKFLKLEGTWRGLNYLVMNSETSAMLKIRMINLPKKDLLKDLTRAVEFDQSQVFKKIYENEFGTPGGEPYGALIGDYEFTKHPDDVEILSKMSGVAAAAFAPFITAAGPTLLGLETYADLAAPRDLEKTFLEIDYAKWRSFRDSDDSRFVALTMPRALARLPYGSATKPIDEFVYEEAPLDSRGTRLRMPHDHYCWMNSAYVMGARMTDSFAQTSWCTSIRGAENGGKVIDLPSDVFLSDDGDLDQQCPTEVAITDRREAELSKLGFLPLCHYKNTDYAVFFGGQTAQKPKKYDRPDATANAALSARLPYIMATSRIAHFLKVIARDKIGSFMEASDCENWLQRWINNYVESNPNVGPEMKARYPLRDAKITVEEIPGAPGSYNAVAHLRPWLQLEELTTSLRLVARIPKKG
jgi:type VI secretion system protein ImpC